MNGRSTPLDAGGIRIWCGIYGDFLIPEQFADIKLRADGWPDRRTKRSVELLEWIAEQEKKARIEMESSTPAHLRARRTQVQTRTPFGDSIDRTQSDHANTSDRP